MRNDLWLKSFYVRAGSDYSDEGVDVVCTKCGDYFNFESRNFTLFELKYSWAYYHFEECGK